MCSIMSGNTCNMTLWSDMKIVLPMLPRISSVLQCPICKKYHYYDRSQIVGECQSWGNASYGYLSYRSLIEAFEQLAPTGKEEKTYRMMLLWAYNDIYWDKDENWRQKRARKYLPDTELFVQNATALIALNPDDVFLKAELYRELGEFDECRNLLLGVCRDGLSPYMLKILDTLIQKAQDHDSRVFAINEPKNRDTIRHPIFDKHPEDCIYDPDNDPYEKGFFELDIDDDM